MATLGLLAVVLGFLARRGMYPALEEPDPAEFPEAADRWRSRLAWLAALAIGAAVAGLLYAMPPERPAAALFRHSAYELESRWIGPLFMLLGATLVAAPILLGRLVSPGPLQHLLWDSAAFIRHVDPRPLSRWVGGAVVVGALVSHLAVRSSHVTLAADGVTWCDAPWSGTQRRAWQDLRRVELVQNYVALAGNVVARPHLRLVFADGVAVVAGSSVAQPPAVWQKAAAIATERSGIAPESVDR